MLHRHYHKIGIRLKRFINKLTLGNIRNFIWFKIALPDKELITPVFRMLFKRPRVRKIRFKVKFEDVLPPSTHLPTKYEYSFHNSKEAIRVLDKIGVEEWGFHIYCKILGIDDWYRAPWVISIIIQRRIDEIPFEKLGKFIDESLKGVELWITPAQEDHFKTLAEALENHQNPPDLTE